MKNKGFMVVLAGIGINIALGVLYTWSKLTAVLTLPLKLENGAPISAGNGMFQSVAVKADQVKHIAESLRPVSVSSRVIAEKAYGWSANEAIMPYVVALAVFAICMVFAGRAQDKLGPRVITTFGGLLVGSGMIMSSYCDMSAGGNHTMMILGFGVFTGAGIGLGYACTTPAAIKWFHSSKKGLITGLVVGGFGAASIYTAPLTDYLIRTYGVGGMFRILGVAFFLVIVGLAQLLQNPPKGYEVKDPAADVQPAAVLSTPAPASRDYTWQEMITRPQFYMLWLMYVLVCFAGLMMIGIIAKVAPEQLANPDFASKYGYTLIIALAIGNGIGRPVAGLASDKIGRSKTMFFVFIAQAICVGFFLKMAHTLPTLMLVAMIIGFNYGANLALFPSATGDFFGTKNLGVNYGLVFTGWGAGGILGSLAGGWIKDNYGSYDNAYVIAAILCVVAAVMVFPVMAPKAEPARPAQLVQA